MAHIKRLAAVGHPPAPGTIHDLASLLRYPLTSSDDDDTVDLPPLGRNWVNKLKKRHPEVQSAWTTAMERSRIDGTSREILSKWMDEYTGLRDQYPYKEANIYNMDETGYAIGSTQSTQVLVFVDNGGEGDVMRNGQRRKAGKAVKAHLGRQEWVTAIECVSADGRALPPFMIFKGEAPFSKRWIPKDVDTTNWQWWTSYSGWTNDLLATEWLVETFQHLTAPADRDERRLLIVDGHGSHVTSKFIGFCMRNAIDVLVLPPHSSHITQPLDVGVFGPLKREVGRRTDGLSVIQPGRIARVKWAAQLVTSRLKAMTKSNIMAGWRGAGLVPINPQRLISPRHRPTPPSTPPRASRTPLAPLASENRKFIRENSALMVTPIKERFWDLANGLERSEADRALLEKENSELRALVNPSKRPRAGITVPNMGTHHFTTPSVAQAIRTAETSRRSKKRKGKQREVPQDSPELACHDSFLHHHLQTEFHA